MARGIVRDLTGQRFGDWLVIGRTQRPLGSKSRNAHWLCRCNCGNQRSIRGEKLTSGGSKSCGCFPNKSRRVPATKASSTPITTRTYRIWRNMKQRCFNKNHCSYHYYGGRGITVCDRWRDSFATFLADVGICPGKDFSLDRIDVNGNYESSNCRWATECQQQRNKRNNVRVVVNGRLMCVADLEQLCGSNRSRVRRLIEQGMNGDEVLAKFRDDYLKLWPAHPCA